MLAIERVFMVSPEFIEQRKAPVHTTLRYFAVLGRPVLAKNAVSPTTDGDVVVEFSRIKLVLPLRIELRTSPLLT
ncbi:MAG: hypothetical protein ACREFV_09505 [Acetobacteraceae bacterium]